MDQLDILADLSELRLLRDLAALAKRRSELSRIDTDMQTVRRALADESRATESLQTYDHASTRLYSAYVENTQNRLKMLQEARNRAHMAADAAQQAALHAQGRVRAIAILQKRSVAERQTRANRREETMSMARPAAITASWDI